MANREPSKDRRPLTCETLHELASAYLPILSFTSGERHFPLRVESWLAHATAADWEDAPETFHDDDLPGDPHWRGTAMMRDRDGVFERVAGPPNAGNMPLLMPGRAQAAVGRGQGDTFLNFAGWDDGTRRHGDPSYLYAAFSEQAAAIGTSNVWEAFDDRVNKPALWVPQPVAPTTYAEFSLVRSFAELDRQMHDMGGDFPIEVGGARYTDLDDLLCLTYHFFYAFEDHATSDSVPRRREGQWEAASLFFPVGGSGPAMLVSEPPLHVVLTRGQTGDRHQVMTQEWGDIAVVPSGGTVAEATPGASGTQPLFFVAQGTHHLFSDPTGLHPDPPESPPLDSTLGGGASAGQRFWMFLALAAWALALVVWLAALILAALALAAIAAILAVIFAILVVLFMLIALLCALFCSSDSSTDAQPDTQEAEDDAPSAGDTSDPAGSSGPGSGGTPGSGGSSQGPNDPGGQPSGGNAGSPTGRNTVPMDLRVVDLVNRPDTTTVWPPDDFCEHPTWWDYAGRWGVHVRSSSAQDWTHGDRRVDADGRSIAYWNSVSLAEALDS